MKMLIPFVMLGLFSCSPYGYKTEINAFGSAVSNLSAAVSTIQTDITTAPGKQAFWTALVRNPKTVRLHRQRCTVLPAGAAKGAPPAELCVLSIDGQTYTISAKQAEVIRAIEPIKNFNNYVASLRAVTNAKDSEEFKAATASLGQNASKLASIGSPMAGPVVSAGIQIIGLVTRSYFEHRRLQVLREVVNAVEDQLPQVTAELGRNFHALKFTRINSLRRRGRIISEAIPATRGIADRERLIRELVAGADAIRALQKSDPVAMTEAMQNAHTALADALAGKQPDLSAVLKTLNEFVAAAKDFNAAVSKL